MDLGLKITYHQSDQKIEKVTQLLEKVAKTIAKPNINIKAQFESTKHLHLTTFETFKYLQKTHFETACLGDNVKNSFRKRKPKMFAIILAANSHEKLPKVAQMSK
jgi:hypothetical protein